MAGELATETRGGVRVLELRRPEKRNALTRELLRALHTGVMDACEDRDIGAVVITGAGGAFCAGWDIEDVKRLKPGEPVVLSREIQRTLRAIETAPLPVIAAVEGPARGGGCGIACAADIRVLGESATIGVPEVALGTIPGGGIVRRLEALVGAGITAELLYTNVPLDAPRALALGLANRVVADGEALEAACAMAAGIAAQRGEAVRAAKRVLLAVRETTPDRLVDIAALEIEGLLGGRGRDA